MSWLLIAAVVAWVLITLVAVAFGRAAAKPWPKRDERWHKE